MKVVLESEGENIIRSIDMKDGQIGIITAWRIFPEYQGRIVQRFGNDLIALGKGEQRGWRDYFREPANNEDKYCVRILPPGSTLRIVEDEE